jgi:transcriptional regulator with XRE-family HTH domain
LGDYWLKKEILQERKMTAKNIRSKRAVAGIPGHAVCRLAGISRAKLSDIEREHVIATPEDLQCIDSAINQILRTRQHLTELAAEAGLSLTGLRL